VIQAHLYAFSRSVDLKYIWNLPRAQDELEPSVRPIYAINFLISGIEQIGKIDNCRESAEAALDGAIQKPIASAVGAPLLGEYLLIVRRQR
jgi:hypothetical protein